MQRKKRFFLELAIFFHFTYDKNPHINGNADESPVLLFLMNLRHTNLILIVNTELENEKYGKKNTFFAAEQHLRPR